MLNIWQVEDLTKKMHPQDEQLSGNHFLTFHVTFCVHSLGPSEKIHQELIANGDVAPKTLRTRGRGPLAGFKKKRVNIQKYHRFTHHNTTLAYAGVAWDDLTNANCNAIKSWRSKRKIEVILVYFHQRVHPTRYLRYLSLPYQVHGRIPSTPIVHTCLLSAIDSRNFWPQGHFTAASWARFTESRQKLDTRWATLRDMLKPITKG